MITLSIAGKSNPSTTTLQFAINWMPPRSKAVTMRRRSTLLVSPDRTAAVMPAALNAWATCSACSTRHAVGHGPLASREALIVLYSVSG